MASHSPTADPSTPTTIHAAADASELPLSVTAPTGRIDAYLDEYLSGLPLPTNLIEAMRYSALGPGKRARPLLCWHAFAAVAPDADPKAALPACTAVEMVHAFSLVHDDLPGLDNDDLRRGRPTLHKHTSEAMAVLAGDCLLTSAFQALADRVSCETLRAKLTLELATGTNGMIAGQIYDTLGGFPAGLKPIQQLETIHRNKTGMLIRAACRMGALTALDGRPGANRFDALGAITSYAEAIGLMFQVVDDLLDVTQSTEHLGKKSGKDVEAGKLTYPGVLGVDKTRDEVRRLYDLSLGALEPLGEAAEPLRQLSTYMAVRTK
ncbi:MAG: polyprenyl synthetase family protein [Phycisphaerales bacterium]|nr:polyprenyl synthetase family protein [Phycisphaerales bacterium]